MLHHADYRLAFNEKIGRIEYEGLHKETAICPGCEAETEPHLVGCSKCMRPEDLEGAANG